MNEFPHYAEWLVALNLRYEAVATIAAIGIFSALFLFSVRGSRMIRWLHVAAVILFYGSFLVIQLWRGQ